MNWLFKLAAHCVLAFFSICNCHSAFGQCKESDIKSLKRTALVIGETNYVNLDILNNPVNDAVDMSHVLTKLNFQVKLDTNDLYDKIKHDIHKWVDSLPKYDIAIFYFAGHGSEIDGINYIYPVDAQGKPKSAVVRTTFSVKDLLSDMENAHPKVCIILLDACRDNPTLRSSRRSLLKHGFGSVALLRNPGVLMGFSTAPGEKTPDGNSRNGYYTRALVENLDLPNKKLLDIFAKTSDDCQIYSGNKQVPYISTSIGDQNNYCLLYDHQSGNAFIDNGISDTLWSKELENIKNTPRNPIDVQKHIAKTTFDMADQIVYTAMRPILDSIKQYDFDQYTLGRVPEATFGDTSVSDFYNGMNYTAGNGKFLIACFKRKLVGNQFSFTIASNFATDVWNGRFSDERLIKFENEHALTHEFTLVEPANKIDWDKIQRAVRDYFRERIPYVLSLTQ